MKFNLSMLLLCLTTCLAYNGCAGCRPDHPQIHDTTTPPSPHAPESNAPISQETLPPDTQPIDTPSLDTPQNADTTDKNVQTEWPPTDEEIVSSKTIPDYAKYALAIDRALGCDTLAYDSPEYTYNVKEYDFISTSIYDCTEPKNPNLLNMLIQNKADINAYNAHGRTLLSMTLTGIGNEEFHENPMFELLLASGADITKPDADGTTILMKTLFYDTAEKFIAAGGDIHAKDKQGHNALDLQKAIRLEMDGEDIVDEDGHTWHMPFFWEENTMGCHNDDEIEEAEAAGQPLPDCYTYADLIRRNVDQIITRLENMTPKESPNP